MKYIMVILLFISGTLSAKEQLVLLAVPGMNCAACPVTVKKSLERVEGVKLVNVVYKRKTAEVSFNDQLTNIGILREATKNAGYPSHVVKGKK